MREYLLGFSDFLGMICIVHILTVKIDKSRDLCSVSALDVFLLTAWCTWCKQMITQIPTENLFILLIICWPLIQHYSDCKVLLCYPLQILLMPVCLPFT